MFNSKTEGIKNKNNNVLCHKHNQPIIKIQVNSQKFLCESCLNQKQDDLTLRMQMERAQLTNKYKIVLEELKLLKKKTDKITQIFMSNNLVEAKKIIKKTLPDAQKLIDSAIDNELIKANAKIKQYITSLLSNWNQINGKQLSAKYVEFYDQLPIIEQSIIKFKNQIKKEIADQIKNQVHTFYEELFEF